MDQFAQARQNMIDCQLRTNGITDTKILNAFNQIPREHFLPASLKPNAYIDEDIIIDENSFLMEPMVFGKILNAAELKKNDFTMVVGCMTGYMAAIISQLVTTVMLVMSDQEKLNQAQEKIEQLGINNIIYIIGDHTKGHPEQAPYDVIFMCGCVPETPVEILNQLSDAGRCVSFEPDGEMHKAIQYRQHNGLFSKACIADVGTCNLHGFTQEETFEF